MVRPWWPREPWRKARWWIRGRSEEFCGTSNRTTACWRSMRWTGNPLVCALPQPKAAMMESVLWWARRREPHFRAMLTARQPSPSGLNNKAARSEDYAPLYVSDLLVTVGCFRGLFQFAVDFVQQIFRLLRVTFHVPLIGLLRGYDLLESLLAEALGRRDVRMATGVDVSLGWLSDGPDS